MKKMKSPGIAVLISLFIPGGGSMYCEKVGEGIGLLIGTIIGYCVFIIPGICMHIISMVAAYADAKATARDPKTNLPLERKCPFCAEMVKTEAKICRYCGKDLPELVKEADTGNDYYSRRDAIKRGEKVPPWNTVKS